LIDAIISGELAARFKEEGVAAYVDLVQNKERRLGLDILTHQKWFAVSYPLYYRLMMDDLSSQEWRELLGWHSHYRVLRILKHFSCG
jgi:Isocitrate lyase family